MRQRDCVKCIAIAGPSASGKSSLAKRLCQELGKDKAVILCQDDYYKDWSHLPKKTRKKINFDDYKVFDLDLLAKHIKLLKKGDAVLAPLYDFVGSKRLKKTKRIYPKIYVIVEGLMPFYASKMRRLFDYKIYINADSDICLSRRLKRDIKERAESIDSVCKRYFQDVLPMQKRYVEPQKKWADWVVRG